MARSLFILVVAMAVLLGSCSATPGEDEDHLRECAAVCHAQSLTDPILIDRKEQCRLTGYCGRVKKSID